MGLSESKKIRVLLVGLTGSGKTHLLDFMTGESNTVRQPTIGYHEVTIQYEGRSIIITEYGGTTDWEKLVQLDTDEFNCIWMIIGHNADGAALSSSNNALLMVSSLLPNVPVAIVNNRTVSNSMLGLHQLSQLRPVCTVTLNFDIPEECLEKIYRLLQWTSAPKNTV
jgi:GTPase SAR1 family protein